MNHRTRYCLVGAFCALGSTAFAAPVILTNQGFESGNLAPWDTTGDVTVSASTQVTTFDGKMWSVLPFQKKMAQLVSSGSDRSDLDKFFYFPATSTQMRNQFFSLPSGFTEEQFVSEFYNGSGIQQSFSGNKDDVVTQYWNFFSRENAADLYLDQNGDPTIPTNDTAFAVITDSDLNSFLFLLANTQGVKKSGYSGWQRFDYALPADGTYTISFGVVNWRDDYIDALLFVDDGIPVSEPASLALLGLGLASLGGLRRKKPVRR